MLAFCFFVAFFLGFLFGYGIFGIHNYNRWFCSHDWRYQETVPCLKPNGVKVGECQVWKCVKCQSVKRTLISGKWR